MTQPPHLQKTLYITIAVAIVMFGFSFAMAPLYNALCRATGFGGKTNLVPYVATDPSGPDLTHPLIVQFTTATNAKLPWDFRPQQTSIRTFPNNNTKVIFYVKNNTAKTMTVQAIPSISPWQAAKYFHKIECFCFTQQTLKPGEVREMPVVFRIDKQVPRDIHVITLAYTLFDITSTLPRSG